MRFPTLQRAHLTTTTALLPQPLSQALEDELLLMGFPGWQARLASFKCADKNAAVEYILAGGIEESRGHRPNDRPDTAPTAEITKERRRAYKQAHKQHIRTKGLEPGELAAFHEKEKLRIAALRKRRKGALPTCPAPASSSHPRSDLSLWF